MSGIYVHIPFCKKACHYCNFHFSTSLKLKDDMIIAICKEIGLRKDYLRDKTLDSVYFGGGTPSLMEAQDLEKILKSIHDIYTLHDDAEVTLEANPDDITTKTLKQLKDLGINRLSIGLQSFHDQDLKWMNRVHTAAEGYDCIKRAQDIGFDNLSIDLIYGSPTTSDEMWQYNIEQTLSLNIPHLSAYCLTVEENTALHHFIAKNKIPPLNTDKAVRQFEILTDALNRSGYLHYEISNFAKPESLAVHNTNYWRGHHYIGIGPSAHSFDGQSRSWNIAHNKKYIDSIAMDLFLPEVELMDIVTQYNEYVMISLRTMWGINPAHIKTFGTEINNYFLKEIKHHLLDEIIHVKEGNFVLTKRGILFADQVAMKLFYIED